MTKLILYVESVGATTEYYIDDFRITEVVSDQTGFVCDFETDRNSGRFCFTAQDGGDRNWTPLGTAVLANVTEEAHGGTRSLRANRPCWQGPALNILGNWRLPLSGDGLGEAGGRRTGHQPADDRRAEALGHHRHFHAVLRRTPSGHHRCGWRMSACSPCRETPTSSP